MTSYDGARLADSKRVCVVWDFPDLSTRFVTEEHTGLALPGGYTQFVGAVPGEDSGTQLAVAANSLTVGTAEFRAPDIDQALTVWLKAHDGVLSTTRVIRREGFVGVPEGEYKLSRWVLRDFAVAGRAGGGYEFQLDNVLAPMSRPLYDEFDGETYRLGTITRNGSLTNNSAVVTGLSQTSDLLAGMSVVGTNCADGARILSVDSASQITMTKVATGGGTQSLTFSDLVSSATTIRLDKSPKGIWREPGYALLYNRDAKLCELVLYQTIGGSGDLDLQSVTRRKLGVGPPSFTFAESDSEVAQVWAKRGNPIDVVLEWLTTTANGVSPAEKVTNGDFEAWASATDATGWTETITGGSVNRDGAARLQGSYSCRADRTGAGALSVHHDFSGLTPGLWYRLRIASWASATIANGLMVQLKNLTTGKDLQAAGTTWGTAPQTALLQEVGATKRHFWLAFQVDAGAGAGDSYRLVLDAANASVGQSISWELASIFGPFSAAPNGPYDVGDGDGLGAWIDVEYLDIAQIEAVRDQYWPLPSWSGDAKASGSAVLFVEKEPVDDLKRWVEDNVLTPFALFPTTDASERFSIESWFHPAIQAEALAGDWAVGTFNAGQWKRNYQQRINNASLLADWDAIDGRHSFRRGREHDPSILRFGKAKAFDLSGRGCRTGRRGFPDYGSLADLDTAATRIFQEAGNPWTELQVTAFLQFINVSIGKAITIDIPTIPDLQAGRRGVIAGEFLVVKRRVHLGEGHVQLTLRLRRSLVRPAIVAPNTVASTYAAATTADRTYCYIAPAATFANGDDAYTVQ